MKNNNTENMIQSVILTFDDGQEAIFVGKAVCFQGETKKIRDIAFSPPSDMPEGCSWGDLSNTRNIKIK